MRAALPLLAVLLASAAPAAADPPMPSPVIFPIQRLPLSFSHQQHLALAATTCSTCHQDAAHSRRGADVNIPAEAVCLRCHPIDRQQPEGKVVPGQPTGRCAYCHPGWNGLGAPPRITIPPPNLKFNHELHVSRAITCVACHGDMTNVNLATRAQLPRMELCLGCHDGKQAPAACTTCHVAGGPGRMQTEYAEGRLVPSGTLRGDAHDLRFRKDHAAVASNDEKYCASCHTRTFCVDCHNGTTKPLDFHANDYLRIHPIDARRASLDCGGCHRQQTFCTGCHSRLGVSTDPKTTLYRSGSPTDARFHPLDSDWKHAGHAVDARRNLRACVSCHREESCLDCHRGMDNPHGAGWPGSARCKAVLSRAGRVCLRCHAAEDATCD